MTPSELKSKVSTIGDNDVFFSRKSMQFFGDSMRNYGVRSATIRTMYNDEGNFVSVEGVEVEVWELYRKKPVNHGVRGSHYFDKVTFKQRVPSSET